MKVRIFSKTITGDNKFIIEAFKEGVNKTDICEIATGGYEPCDVAVIVGGLKYKTTPNGLEIAGSASRVRKPVMDRHPMNIISIESPIYRKNYDETNLLDNEKIRRVSWGGYLFDDGRFLNENSPSDRWYSISKKQNIEIKPWRQDGDHILITLQKENDSSLKGVDNFTWATNVIKEIRQYTDRKIIIRGHPLNKRPYPPIEGTTFSQNALLEDDLKNCWALVSYTSLSSVEAVCEGIPVFTNGVGNMAWPVANHDFSTIENPYMPERTQWLFDTAYMQWSMDEFADGSVWQHLRKGYMPIPSMADSKSLHGSFSSGKKKKKKVT